MHEVTPECYGEENGHFAQRMLNSDWLEGITRQYNWTAVTHINAAVLNSR